MQRLSGDRADRGAVATFIAALVVPLLGFAAISVDVAGMWSDKQMEQDAADAAVIAVAQQCAKALVTGLSSCGSVQTTAQTYARQAVANSITPTASVLTSNLTPSTGQVSVRSSEVRQHSFAPILGINSSTIYADATAMWGAPSGGTAVLPLIFSWCEWYGQTGGGMPSTTTVRTIYFTKSSTVNCYGPSRNALPGGFGWLDVNSGTCKVAASINQWLTSSTGASVPSSCSSIDFSSQQNNTVLLPLFDDTTSQGNNGKYHLYGFAAFQLTGYNFPNASYTWNADDCLHPTQNCIKGYFKGYVDISSALTYSTSAPQLGLAVIKLSQ